MNVSSLSINKTGNGRGATAAGGAEAGAQEEMMKLQCWTPIGAMMSGIYFVP